MAEKLNAILKNYVAEGTSTKDKLLGAAFVVVSKHGIVTMIPSSLSRNLPPQWSQQPANLYTPFTL